MRILISLSLIFLIILSPLIIESNNRLSRYEPNWDSLDSRPLPEWYDKSKIGIFIHWGVFSVPSFASEWFWNFWIGNPDYESWHQYIVEFMTKNFKPNFTYENFAPDFKAEFFNATEWADLIEKSGAKYAVLTTKHHEGFTLWPSSYSFNWNAMDVGPKRDLVGEFSDAIRNKGLHLGLYYSLFEWYNPVYDRDRENNFTTNFYVKSKARPELEELINTYKPDLLWSDGDGECEDTYWESTDILAWLYNDSPVKDMIVTNDRWGSNCHNKHGGYWNGADRNNPDHLPSHKWEDAMTLTDWGWGYRRDLNINNYFQIEQVIEILLNTMSLGGNLLINIGPTSDGRIMPIFEERLLQLGEWLNVNGEAIYESHIWKECQNSNENQIYYIAKNDNIYGFSTQWPESGFLDFQCIQYENVKRIELLGWNQPIEFGPGPRGTVLVQFPDWMPDKMNNKLKYAYGFKFIFSN